MLILGSSRRVTNGMRGVRSRHKWIACFSGPSRASAAPWSIGRTVQLVAPSLDECIPVAKEIALVMWLNHVAGEYWTRRGRR